LHSRYLKIEAVGVVATSSFVWRDMVAYKPLGLTDHILWVTDMTQTGKPALLGYPPWIDMDNKTALPNPPQNPLTINSGQTDVFKLGDFLPVHFEGPMRFDAGVEFRGDNADGPPASGQPKNSAWGSIQDDLIEGPQGYSTDDAWRPTGGGYDRGDLFEANGIIEDSRGTDGSNASIPAQSATVNIISNGTSTSNTIWATNDSTAPPYAAFNNYGGYVLGNLRSDNSTQSGTMDTLKAPDILAVDPNSHMPPRYYALTRDSGPVIKNPTTNETANIGRYGHGKGIYIDNTGDLQFFNNDGTHDLQALQDDWMGNLSNNDPRVGDSGWNATHTMYVPRGVEITLYDTEDEALEGGALSAVTALTPPTLTPSQVWWPGHQTGQPGIRLTRHDHRWMVADPTNPGSLDDDSGTNVMYVDYPPAGNQVIYAEGNVRIHGILPPDPNAGGKYNLTVVSGGTIYVDGQILSPQDVAGRATGSNGIADAVPDEQNSYIALLALDCVVVNPTQIVPALTQGMVTSAPDDATAPLTSAQHWELRPGLGGSVYSNWMFGEPPTSDGMPAGSSNQVDPINLVPYHTGQDPGPAGMTLSLYNDKDGAWGTYDFDPTTGSAVLNGFLFAPPGAFATGGGPNISNVFAPQWLPSGNTTPILGPTIWPLAGQGTKAPPAPLTEYVSPNPGDTNGVAFEYLDPGSINVLNGTNLTHLGGAGGTDYWLKKFKIEELDPVLSSSTMPIPKAAVHAKINALMYAENGCFFVIPPPLFDANAAGDATQGSAAPDPADRFRRLNYDIEILGAITEDFQAPPAAWGMWQDQAAYPQYIPGTGGGTPTLAWGTIEYIYDETMLASRVEPPTQLTSANIRYGTQAPSAPGTNLPKFPLLPACPGLIYQGAG
jgi:hypothetical protein